MFSPSSRGSWAYSSLSLYFKPDFISCSQSHVSITSVDFAMQTSFVRSSEVVDSVLNKRSDRNWHRPPKS